LILHVTAVFVPYQRMPNGSLRKRNDLPRFATSREVAGYIHRFNQALSKWQLEWREEHDAWALKEYFHQVGGRNQ